MKSPSRTMWEQPWGYAEAFAIPVALLLGAAVNFNISSFAIGTTIV